MAELSKDDAAKIVQRAMDSDPLFRQGLELALINSDGNLVIVGSPIYGNLAHELHGVTIPFGDYDFIPIQLNPEIKTISGWDMKKNKYGHPRFINEDGVLVDVAPVVGFSGLDVHGFAPTFENFLRLAPLTVQAIGYDYKRREIIDLGGLKAVTDKTVGISNRTQAGIVCASKGISMEKLVRDKAEKLGFTPLL